MGQQVRHRLEKRESTSDNHASSRQRVEWPRADLFGYIIQVESGVTGTAVWWKTTFTFGSESTFFVENSSFPFVWIPQRRIQNLWGPIYSISRAPGKNAETTIIRNPRVINKISKIWQQEVERWEFLASRHHLHVSGRMAEPPPLLHSICRWPASWYHREEELRALLCRNRPLPPLLLMQRR